MSLNVDYVHGIVLYTISDDELRQKLHDFICQHEKLKGNLINESSYSIHRSGDKEGKDVLAQFCKDKSFGPDDFVRVYYSSVLAHSEKEYRDQIVVYHIVEKGKPK